MGMTTSRGQLARPRGRFAALLVPCLLIVALGGWGCGSEEEVDSVDSGVEGVPIPATAERTADAVDRSWRVPDLDYGELVEWYRDELPAGEDHGDWAWCDIAGGADEAIYEHVYVRDEHELLRVGVTNQDPPTVVIGTDRADTC